MYSVANNNFTLLKVFFNMNRTTVYAVSYICWPFPRHICLDTVWVKVAAEKCPIHSHDSLKLQNDPYMYMHVDRKSLYPSLGAYFC